MLRGKICFHIVISLVVRYERREICLFFTVEITYFALHNTGDFDTISPRSSSKTPDSYRDSHLLPASDFNLSTSNALLPFTSFLLPSFGLPTLEPFCFGFAWWVVLMGDVR